MTDAPLKAPSADFLGRFREIISDPLNLLIDRVAEAGTLRGNDVCLHNGNWVPVSGQGAYYGAFSQILIVNRGVHEPLEEYVFQELLKALPQAPVMIELGAYWGHYSMWLKKARPQATTVLVESDPANLAAARNNFQRNGFQGEFVAAAVAKGAFEIDRYLAASRIGHIDILHVDIEGAELDMLADAQETLSRQKVDYLFISTHSQELHTAVIAALGKHGYRVELASDFDTGTTACDGFVFAVSPHAKQIIYDFVPLGRVDIARSNGDALSRYVWDVRRSQKATPSY